MGFTPKLAIFDLDGTLVELPRHYIFSEADRVLQLMGFEAVEREHMEHNFSAFDFFGFMEPEHKDSFAERYWDEFCWDHYPKTESFPFTRGVLEDFNAAGISRAIATARVSTSDDLRKELSEHADFSDLIEVIEARETAEHEWTDKQPQIARVCQQYGVSPKEAMLVGDIPADVVSAKEAGIGFTVAVLSGGIRKEVLEAVSADLVLPDISSLPELLLRS